MPFKSLTIIFLLTLLFKAQSQNVSIAALQMNVFYVGIDNPVRIAVENVPTKNLIIEITEGKITPQKDEPGVYIVHLTSPGSVAIRVRQKLGKDRSKLLSEQKFRVKRIPDPVVTLGGHLRGGFVNSNAIRSTPGLVAILENTDFEARFSIKQFKVITCQNGDIIEIENEGPVFNKKVRNLLDSSKSGDALYFEDIIVISPNSQPQKVEPLRFMIDGYISHT
ncbi:MAG: gliding motility-associated protein GldM, partial [Bacteroidota bacterium]|nr:gliding motility-associated protein GldM [Bacteroidota bacterium]